MTYTQDYKLNFTSNAKELLAIFEKIKSVINDTSGKLVIPDKLKDGFKKISESFAKFQKDLDKNILAEGAKPDDEIFGSMTADLEKLTKTLKDFSLELTKLGVPKDLTDQLTKQNAALEKQTEELKKLKEQRDDTFKYAGEKGGYTQGAKNEAIKQSGLSSVKDSSGLSITSVKQANAEWDKLAKEYNDLLAKAKEAEKAGAIVSEEDKQKMNELAAQMSVLTNGISKYKQILENLKNTSMSNRAAIDSQIAAKEKDISTTQEEIQSTLEKIASTKEEGTASKEVTEATTQLTNLTDKNTDAIDKNKKAIREQKEELDRQKEIEKELAKANEIAKDANEALIAAQRESNKTTQKGTTLFAKAAKTVISYGTIISLLRRAYSETISTIKDMDKALTGMAVVTSMSREQTWQLVGSFQELANQTGKTTSEIASMATKFYQQGKSTQQVLQLTEAAAKAATIAGIDGSRSIDLLTNAMNGFQMSADKAMEVSDKFAALAASAATNYEELATALSKVAAQANLAGMSMDFTLGMLTKGIEVTREAPETIGTALKTVIARMRELTDYGKTLEDNVDVNRVEKALGNIGVELRDENGQFRDLESVLTEVGMKWDTLNKNQQANVAVALAGTRQQSRLIAMMQNFDRTLELVNTSENSYGATMAQSAKYMEGLEAKLTLLTNSYQNLIMNITNSDFVVGAVEFITMLIDGVQAIANEWTAVAAIFTVIGLASAGLITNKIQELYLQRQINAYMLQKEMSDREARISELKAIENASKLTEEKRKQEIVNKKQALDIAKQNLQKAISLKLEKQQTLEDKKQSILNDSSLSEEQKKTKIYEAEAEAATEISKAEADIGEKAREVNTIKNEIAVLESNRNLTEAESLELKNLELQQSQSQNKLLSAQGGILGKIVGTLGMIRTIHAAITRYKERQVLLQKSENKEVKKGLLDKLKSAFFGAADSAASNPFWGWAVAIAIIAAAGIAIGVAVGKAFAEQKRFEKSTEGTADNLNKMQANLYNINKSISTISKLADEFEELDKKVIKSSEDISRMAEIVQQVNDEAGFNVIDTNASNEQQLMQIKGYLASKEVQRKEGIQEIKNGIETGFQKQKGIDNYNESQYIKGLGAAGESALRTIAADQLEYLPEMSAVAQELIKQAFVDAAPDMLKKGGGKLDMTSFTQGFAQFSKEIDTAVQSGSLAEYKELIQILPKELASILIKSNGMFKAATTLSDKAIAAFDALKLSNDTINTVLTLTAENAETGGKTFDEIINAANKAAGATGNLREEIYKELVAEQYAAAERAKIWEQTKKQSDSTELAKQQKIVDELTNKINNEKNDKKREKLEKEYQTELEKLGYLQDAFDRNNNAAQIAEENIRQLNNEFLVSKPISDYTDRLTQLSSTMERLTKVNDLTSLSFAEQMNLLGDYPELINDIKNGTLTSSGALKILQDDFDEILSSLEQQLKDYKTKWKETKDFGIISSLLGNDLFSEQGIDKMTKLTLDGVDSFVNKLESAGVSGDIARSLFGDIQSYLSETYMRNELNKGGIALALDVTIESSLDKLAIQSTSAQLDAYETMLKRAGEGTDEYNKLLLEQTKLQEQQIKNLTKTIDADQSRLKGFFGDIEDKSLSKILNSFEIVNGTVVAIGENYAKLNAEEIAALKIAWSNLETYAKEQKNNLDTIYELYEALAQKEIDAQKTQTENLISELESRKDAYSDYFNELDALQEEQDRSQTKDSLIKQISSLAGALDATSKSKIKDLRQQLIDLQEQELESQRQKQRDAMLETLDNEIMNLNSQLDKLDASLGEYVKQLMSISGINTYYETVPKFAQGGLVNYTGPAWVDGTPTNPEAFLSATDVRLIQDLVSAIQIAPVEQANTGITIGNIEIKTDHLDTNQDFNEAGNVLADALLGAIKRRGINTNARK